MAAPTCVALRQLPGGVWVLGMVSLLMDNSSEMIHSLLPLFMETALGASAFTSTWWNGWPCPWCHWSWWP